MDSILCDELLQEIFHRLPPPSSAAVSLVSKRWLRLLRSSTTSLSLRFPNTAVTSLSAFLAHHPYLSRLSLSAADDGEDHHHHLLSAVASSSPNLRHLRFLNSPVSPFSLYCLSSSCTHLSSISLTISRPLSFHWLNFFNSLKTLSLFLANPLTEISNREVKEIKSDEFVDVGLNLESLSLCGILPGDYELNFIWRNCRNLKNLQLKSCESLGDYSSFSGFVKFLTGLKVLELRTCRSIVDLVLFKLAETCVSLESLLVYDGCSREGLLQFINRSSCRLKSLDLRLPLDLDNTHLIALSENLNFRGLVSLRLQSCCLVTGEGLKALVRAINGLEELVLINCDVVERESGLLTSLGQSLRRLRKLDLSYNDLLFDKELMSMLVSCGFLSELKLRGCGKLSNVAAGSIVRSCKELRGLDVTYCSGVKLDGIEFLVVNLPRLRKLEVENGKVSEAAREWASRKFVEIVC